MAIPSDRVGYCQSFCSVCTVADGPFILFDLQPKVCKVAATLSFPLRLQAEAWPLETGGLQSRYLDKKTPDQLKVTRLPSRDALHRRRTMQPPT